MNILAGVLFGWFCEISNTARRVLENLQQHSTGSVFTVQGHHPAMAWCRQTFIQSYYIYFANSQLKVETNCSFQLECVPYPVSCLLASYCACTSLASFPGLFQLQFLIEQNLTRSRTGSREELWTGMLIEVTVQCDERWASPSSWYCCSKYLHTHTHTISMYSPSFTVVRCPHQLMSSVQHQNQPSHVLLAGTTLPYCPISHRHPGRLYQGGTHQVLWLVGELMSQYVVCSSFQNCIDTTAWLEMSSMHNRPDMIQCTKDIVTVLKHNTCTCICGSLKYKSVAILITPSCLKNYILCACILLNFS